MTRRNKALTSTFTDALAIDLTEALASTRLQRAPKAGSSRRRWVLGAVLCLSTVGIQSANAKPIDTSDLYKLYAHSRIINDKQYQCFVKIINKENRSWDVRARNGSHYGLGQMRSTWYRDLDAYRQIDATLKYITNRYDSICHAWHFHTQRNYY
jgi:hypothetical protein